MSLSPRKSIILEAVVECYIKTGEQVGSKTLLDILEISVSSATIRNELASLSENGFLIQPHTSAGRIPLPKGYRYYIDKIMESYLLSSVEKDFVLNRLYKVFDDPERILKEASFILSGVTGLCSVCTTPTGENARIKRIHLLQTGRQTAMAVLITSTGMIKNRLFRCDYVLTAEVVTVFERLVNKKFCGQRVEDITQAFIQSSAVEFGELAMLMPNVLMAIMESAKEASMLNATISGKTNVLFLEDFNLNDIRLINKFLSDNSQIQNLLLSNDYDTTVFVGRDSNRGELENCSVITKRYNIAGEPAGAIALLGPVRMDYKKNIALIEFMCDTVGTLISELLEI